MAWNPAQYLPWNSWGGTAHLEKKSSAREKYKERLRGWSDTKTWGRWLDSDRITALNDADAAYSYAENATDYWARVAQLWRGYADTMQSIHPEQFAKILTSVGVSKDAAKTYENNRNWVPYVKDALPKPKDLPWWVWPAGAVAVWISIRR